MLDQQLQVRLTGKVGRKIKVDVDYDDKALASQQQKISVVYTGDQQEVFKEFAFGDILMDLNSSRTEFAGYNKSLFGAKLKLESPDSRLRITAIGAQTKGFAETKRIVGGFEQAKTGNTLGRDIPDTSFAAYKYYYLSRDKDLVEGGDYIEPGSVEIWIDRQGTTNFQTSAIQVANRTGSNKFFFVRLTPGVDFSVEYRSGRRRSLRFWPLDPPESPRRSPHRRRGEPIALAGDTWNDLMKKTVSLVLFAVVVAAAAEKALALRMCFVSVETSPP
jgi:hypothetical protein